MGLVWNLIGASGILAATLAWSAALLVLLSRPDRTQNRILALALFAEGVAWFGGNGLLYVTTSPDVAYASQALNVYASFAIYATLLAFAGTLETPLSAPFRKRSVRAALAMLFIAAAALFHLRREWWLLGVEPAPYATWEGTVGPAFELNFVLAPFLFLYLLVCTISAYRRAAPGPAKRRAGYFALAFGVRDASFVVLFVGDATGFLPLASVWAFPVATLVFIPLLGYGILKAQLFDIDLRIKWGIQRGTLVGIFAVVFVVVAEAAQNVLSDAYGYVAGGVAAGALLLGLRPLERLSARVADAAMPRVQATDDYLAFRKHEVYRAAVESARQDGVITTRERAVLDSLRASLGIDDRVARDIEGAAPAPPA